MEAGPRIIFNVPIFFAVAVMWSLTWGLIGYLLADRRRPRRFIFVEDSGAWTIGKLERVDNDRDDVF